MGILPRCIILCKKLGFSASLYFGGTNVCAFVSTGRELKGVPLGGPPPGWFSCIELLIFINFI
jgi:hypothetical protein